MRYLKVSTVVTLKLGPFLDEDDGKTAEGGLAIAQADVRLSKNGGAFAQKNDVNAAAHDENGWYGVQINATDTNTLGRLIIAIHEAGALPVWVDCTVVTANVWDSLCGADKLEVDLIQWIGVAPLALNAQRVQTHLGATDAGAIVAATFAANALSAAALAQAAADKVWATAARTLTSYGTLVNDIADQVWNELRAGHAGAGSFGQGVASVQGNVTGSVASVVGSVGGSVASVVGAVGSVTGNVGGNVVGTVASVVGSVASVVGNVGGTVASVVGNIGGNVVGTIGDLAAAAKTSVNAEVDTALVDINLDHLMKVAVSNRDTMPEVVDDTVLANIMTKTDGDTSDFDHATDSLEAIRDNMAGVDVAAIADAVWDELRAGHVGAGSFGQGVASVVGNVGGNVVGTVASVVGNLGGNVIGNVQGTVASVVGNIGGNVVGSVASVVGNVGGDVVGDLQGDVLGNVIGTVASVVGNVGGNVVGTVASVVGAVGSVTGSVGSVLGNLGGNVVGNVQGTVASVVGNVGGNVVGTVASVVGDLGGDVVGDVLGNVVGTVASVVGSVASVVGNVGGNVVGTVASVVGNVGGSVASMLVAGRNEIADSVLSRPITNVDGAVFRSLYGAVAKNVNRVAQAAGILTIYQTDDATPVGTQAITEDVAANPIVQFDTV